MADGVLLSMASKHPIQIVDFAPFLDGSPDSRKAVARKIDTLFQELGFVTLRNHGIPNSSIEDAFIWSEKFFALPNSIKALAPHPPGYEHHRGWSDIGQEKTSQHVYDEDERQELRKVQDVKETFDSGNENDTSQPNIWLPDEYLLGFRTHMEKFFKDCNKLVGHVLSALAIALDLENDDDISKEHSRSLYQLRLNYYPSIPASVLHSGEKGRCAAHSDFGTLTLLFQDSCGGLEIEDPNQPNTFLPVTPVPNTVIVNCGDLMERWSNGRWKSDVHRVVAPPIDPQKSKEAGKEILKTRYSIPFFAAPDPDALIEPLPGCWDEKNNPKKYEPITAHDYVMMRMAAIR
jgi:isopenicillin N synthase-like dioxygenase